MQRRLDGKVAIVTGAARGLGRAYALHLAALGADVAVADVDFAAATAFGEQMSAASVDLEIETLGRRSLKFEGDLARAADAQALVAAAVERFGRVDILVNNAGGNVIDFATSAASTTPIEDHRLIFEINFTTMVNCCQAVAPQMKRQGGGVIVNMSSAASVMILAKGMGASYGAAKAAVTHFTRSLAAELGPFGIRANCIAPGFVLTARVVAQMEQRGLGAARDAARVPLGRYATPEDCALVLEFLATDQSRYVTGQNISVCGGSLLGPS